MRPVGVVAASSEHPLATHAVGEVVGQVLEELGPEPDVAVLFATGPFAGAVEDIADAVRRLVRPHALVGTTAGSVLATGREVEHRAAVTLLAARWDRSVGRGPDGPARAVAFDAHREGDGWRLTGTDEVAVAGATLVLLADPFSFPVEGFVDQLGRREPRLRVVGGMASAATGPGGNRLVADDRVVAAGAVGLYLPPAIPARVVVSQGCRPVGEPFVVTRARGNLVEEIGGRPALDRVLETAEAASPEDRALMASGLHVGLVVDESKLTFGTGDFLVRGVIGADRTTRAVALGAEVAVGDTIQFQVRDADSADEDLRATLATAAATAPGDDPPLGAVVFTCNGRGEAFFGEPHHDAQAIDAHLGGGPSIGMSCAGEIAPVGSATHVHTYSTAALLLDP